MHKIEEGENCEFQAGSLKNKLLGFIDVLLFMMLVLNAVVFLVVCLYVFLN